MKFQKLALAIPALLLALPMTGGAVSSTAVAAPPGEATVTVIHGIPGVPVDVFVNGDLTLENFQPESVTDPITVAPGDYDIEIVERFAGNVVISETVSVADGVDASVVASVVGDDELGLQVFQDDTSQLPLGTSRYQFRNASNAPEKVYGGFGSDEGFGFTGGLLPGEETGTRTINTERGPFTYTGGYGIAGAGPRVSFFADQIDGFDPGVDKSYNAYVIGSAELDAVGSLTVVLQEVQTEPQPPRPDGTIPFGGVDSGIVSVIHGIPGAVVDVYVDGNLALEDFRPRTVTAPIELPAGPTDIVVAPANGDPITDALIDQTVDVPPASNVSLVASILDNGDLGLQAFVNDTTPVPFNETRYLLRNAGDTPEKAAGIYGFSEGFLTLAGLFPGDESQSATFPSEDGPFFITGGYGIAGPGTRVPFFSGALPNFDGEAAKSYVGFIVGSAELDDVGSLTVVVQELTSSAGTPPPQDTTVTKRIEATSFSNEFGRGARGSVDRVFESDNARLRQRTRFDAAAGLDRQELIFAFSAQRGPVLDLDITMESRIRRQPDAQQTIGLRNWTTGDFDVVSTEIVRSGRDQRFVIDEVSNAADYVRASDGFVLVQVQTAAELDAGERLIAQFDEISLEVTTQGV